MRYQEPNNPLFAYPLPSLPAFPLPPLPPILDVELRESVFTHVSVQGLNRRGVMSLSPPEEGWERARDYERLEHVGDGLLESIASGLIQDLYPWLRQGGAAIVRDHLVANSTLAQLSLAYDLPSQIIADVSSTEYVLVSVKIQASVLEAYIAGVFYSYLKYGDGSSPSAPLEFEAVVDTGITTQYEGIAEVDHTTPASAGYDRVLEPTPMKQTPTPTITPTMTPAKKLATSTHTSPTAELEDLVSSMMATTLKNDNAPHGPPVSLAQLSIKSKGVSRTSQQNDLMVAPTPMASMDSLGMRDRAEVASPGGSELNLFCEVHEPVILPGPLQTNRVYRSPRLELVSTSPSITELVDERGTVPTPLRTKGQAYDHLISWLVPLLTPYARWIHSLLVVEQQRILSHLPPEIPRLETPATWEEEDEQAQGSVRALAQHRLVEGGRGDVRYEKTPELGQRWKVACTLVDMEGREWHGEAIRSNHRSAKVVAAWKVYTQLSEVGIEGRTRHQRHNQRRRMIQAQARSRLLGSVLDEEGAEAEARYESGEDEMDDGSEGDV